MAKYKWPRAKWEDFTKENFLKHKKDAFVQLDIIGSMGRCYYVFLVKDDKKEESSVVFAVDKTNIDEAWEKLLKTIIFEQRQIGGKQIGSKDQMKYQNIQEFKFRTTLPSNFEPLLKKHIKTYKNYEQTISKS